MAGRLSPRQGGKTRIVELPQIEVRYGDLTHVVTVPVESISELPSLPRTIAERLRGCKRFLSRRPRQTVSLDAIAGVSGVLRAGTSTLIISAPGAGTTSFLRLLSGRLAKQNPGQVLYNGVTEGELEAGGVGLKRLAVYAPERDENEALLTVRETFDFIASLTYRAAQPDHAGEVGAGGKSDKRARPPPAGSQLPAPPQFEPLEITRTEPVPALPTDVAAVVVVSSPHSPQAPEEGRREHDVDSDGDRDPAWWARPRTPEEMISVLELGEAADTVVGSDMVRGVSGGQRKRVTVGEALLMGGRLLCLDSATSGLDASTALHLVRYVTQWAARTGGTCLMALQQPTPEIGACFDDLILLSEGLELYHGPVTGLEGYLAALGYLRPRYMDILDYASELVAFPERAAEVGCADARERAAKARSGGGSGRDVTDSARRLQTDAEPAVPASGADAAAAPAGDDVHRAPTLTTIAALAAHWRASPSFASMMRFDLAPAIGSGASKGVNAPPNAEEPQFEPLQIEPATLHRPAGDQARASNDDDALPVTIAARPSLLASATTRVSAPAPFTSPRQALRPVDTPHAAAAAPRSKETTTGTDTAVLGDSAEEVDVNAGRFGAPATGGVVLASAHAKRAYGVARPVSLWRQVALTMAREVKLVYRNRALVVARVVNGVLAAVIVGTIFMNTPDSDFQTKFGLGLYSTLFISFTNNAVLPGEC